MEERVLYNIRKKVFTVDLRETYYKGRESRRKKEMASLKGQVWTHQAKHGGKKYRFVDDPH